MPADSESDYKRPTWLVPTQYNDEPPVTAPAGRDENDPPIDYSKGPNRSEVFGDDSYDLPEPEAGGVES